jgi:hypothetical protein
VSKEEREFLDELRAKSIEAAAEIMQSLQRLKSLYDEVTDDGSGTPLARPRMGDFFYRLAKYELEHASHVIRLGNAQAEMIFDHVRQLARRTKSGGTPTAVVELAYDASAHAYVGRFEIKNPFDGDADARFEVARLRNAAGDEIADCPSVSCGAEPVRGYRTAQITVSIPEDRVPALLFGEVTVFLLADTERQVAKRVIKVRPNRAEP